LGAGGKQIGKRRKIHDGQKGQNPTACIIFNKDSSMKMKDGVNGVPQVKGAGWKKRKGGQELTDEGVDLKRR